MKSKWLLLSVLSLMSISFVSSGNISAVDPDDYYFNSYGTSCCYGPDSYGYVEGWAYTDGGGSALSKVTVSSKVYINGSYYTSVSDSDRSYASASYNKNGYINKVEFKSTHRIYNVVSEYQYKTSSDYWYNQ